MPRFLKKLFFYFSLAALLGFIFLKTFDAKKENPLRDFSAPKKVWINDNGLIFETQTTTGKVADLLKEKNLYLKAGDKISPEEKEVLLPGSRVEIRRALNLKIEVDGKKLKASTLSRNIYGTLLENGVQLGRLDKTSPELSALPEENLTIVVTRINVEEKTEKEEIAFKTVQKTDDKLSWREKKIQQKGKKGLREIKLKITYRNSKEISRVVLEKKILEEPQEEIVVQGTYVKTGKTHKGLGTWYAWQGGLFAASPWLPLGSYAKVTNVGNGKSVIVQINDRGPFGDNRIIDLDKVAFAKIASLGAGVINVKVEEVLN